MKIWECRTGHSALQCYYRLFRVITFYRPLLLRDWCWEVKIQPLLWRIYFLCMCVRARELPKNTVPSQACRCLHCWTQYLSRNKKKRKKEKWESAKHCNLSTNFLQSSIQSYWISSGQTHCLDTEKNYFTELFLEKGFIWWRANIHQFAMLQMMGEGLKNGVRKPDWNS